METVLTISDSSVNILLYFPVDSWKIFVPAREGEIMGRGTQVRVGLTFPLSPAQLISDAPRLH